MALANSLNKIRRSKKLFLRGTAASVVLALLAVIYFGSSVLAADITGTWQSKTVIVSGGQSYKDDGIATLYVDTTTKYHVFTYKDSDACFHKIYFATSANLNTAKTAKYDDQAHVTDAQNPVGHCTNDGPKGSVNLTNTQANPDPNAGSGDAGSAAGGSDADAPSCQTGTNPLSWFLCPIANGVGALSDALFENLFVGFLKTKPIDLSPGANNAVYSVWSSFRIFGDILLVIALLVVVFGQAIGGGLVDAYTAKKILPRLLLAAILINLSIYIVAFLVDVTNVVGGTVGAVITAPLNGQGAFDISPSGVKMGIIGGVGLAAGGIGAILAIMYAGAIGTAIVGALPFLALFVLLPVILTVIGIFLTLAFRQALIMALVLISPVAFALYCLPNTEQYFKKWWELLSKALLIYPLVMVLFGVSDILAVTAVGGSPGSFFAWMLYLILQFTPLLLVPFAFKMAGGVVGRVHELASTQGKRVTELAKGDEKDPWSMRNRSKRNMTNASLRARESAVGRAISDQGDGKVGRLRRGISTGVGKMAASGNYQNKRSVKNREAAEILQAQVSTGDDSTVRALFARQNPDGTWKGSNGRDFSQFERDEAVKQYGKDPSMYQAALTYELGKAANDDERGMTMATHQLNMKDPSVGSSRGGIWAGAKYSMQQSVRDLKHTAESKSGEGYVRNAEGFTQETAETIGSYPLSNMRTQTVKALRQDHAAAKDYLVQNAILHDTNATPEQRQVAQTKLQNYASENSTLGRTKTRITSAESADRIIKNTQATASSLNQRRQAGGSFALAGEEGSEVPGVQSGAAGRVEQELSRFVDEVQGPQAPRQQVTAPRRPSGGGDDGTINIFHGE